MMPNMWKVREDYQVFDMAKVDAFWWPRNKSGEKACIFSSGWVREGDILVSGRTRLIYVITSVETPMDPGDQHFVDVELVTRSIDDLPASKFQSLGVI